MQEQAYSKEKSNENNNQVKQEKEVFSFQEVHYATSRRKSAFSRWRISGWGRYFTGIGIGVVSVGATFGAYIILLLSVFLWRLTVPDVEVIALIVLSCIIIAVIITVIACFCILRFLFVGCGILTVWLLALPCVLCLSSIGL